MAVEFPQGNNNIQSPEAIASSVASNSAVDNSSASIFNDWAAEQAAEEAARKATLEAALEAARKAAEEAARKAAEEAARKAAEEAARKAAEEAARKRKQEEEKQAAEKAQQQAAQQAQQQQAKQQAAQQAQKAAEEAAKGSIESSQQCKTAGKNFLSDVMSEATALSNSAVKNFVSSKETDETDETSKKDDKDSKETKEEKSSTDTKKGLTEAKRRAITANQRKAKEFAEKKAAQEAKSLADEEERKSFEKQVLINALETAKSKVDKGTLIDNGVVSAVKYTVKEAFSSLIEECLSEESDESVNSEDKTAETEEFSDAQIKESEEEIQQLQGKLSEEEGELLKLFPDNIKEKVASMDEKTKNILMSYLSDDSQEIDISDLNAKEAYDLFHCVAMLQNESGNAFKGIKFKGDDKEAVKNLINMATKAYDDGQGEFTKNQLRNFLFNVYKTTDKSESKITYDDMAAIALENTTDNSVVEAFVTQCRTYDVQQANIEEAKEAAQELHFDSFEDIKALFKNNDGEWKYSGWEEAYGEQVLDVIKADEKGEEIMLDVMKNGASVLDNYIDYLEDKPEFTNAIIRAINIISSEEGGIGYNLGYLDNKDTVDKLNKIIATAYSKGTIDKGTAIAALGAIGSRTNNSTIPDAAKTQEEIIRTITNDESLVSIVSNNLVVSSAENATAASNADPKYVTKFDKENKKIQSTDQIKKKAKDITRITESIRFENRKLEEAKKEAKAKKEAEAKKKAEAEKKAEAKAQEDKKSSLVKDGIQSTQEADSLQEKSEEDLTIEENMYLDKINEALKTLGDKAKEAFEKFTKNGKVDISKLDGQDLYKMYCEISGKMLNDKEIEFVTFEGAADEAVEEIISKFAESYKDGELDGVQINYALIGLLATINRDEYDPGITGIKDLASKYLGEDFDFSQLDQIQEILYEKGKTTKSVKDIANIKDVVDLLPSDSQAKIGEKIEKLSDKKQENVLDTIKSVISKGWNETCEQIDLSEYSADELSVLIDTLEELKSGTDDKVITTITNFNSIKNKDICTDFLNKIDSLLDKGEITKEEAADLGKNVLYLQGLSDDEFAEVYDEFHDSSWFDKSLELINEMYPEGQETDSAEISGDSQGLYVILGGEGNDCIPIQDFEDAAERSKVDSDVTDNLSENDKESIGKIVTDDFGKSSYAEIAQSDEYKNLSDEGKAAFYKIYIGLTGNDTVVQSDMSSEDAAAITENLAEAVDSGIITKEEEVEYLTKVYNNAPAGQKEDVKAVIADTLESKGDNNGAKTFADAANRQDAINVNSRKNTQNNAAGSGNGTEQNPYGQAVNISTNSSSGGAAGKTQKGSSATDKIKSGAELAQSKRASKGGNSSSYSVTSKIKAGISYARSFISTKITSAGKITRAAEDSSSTSETVTSALAILLSNLAAKISSGSSGNGSGELMGSGATATANGVKTGLLNGIDALKNIAEKTGTMISDSFTDFSTKFANNAYENNFAAGKNSNTNSQSMSELTQRSQVLKGSLQSAENAKQGIASGSNEAVKAADNNYENAVSEYKSRVDFSGNTQIQDTKEQIFSIDDNISQELDNIDKYNEGSRIISSQISQQSKLGMSLKTGIYNYENQISGLKDELSDAKSDEDIQGVKEIEKSISKAESQKKELEIKEKKAQASEAALREQQNVLKGLKTDSEIAIGQYSTGKQDARNGLSETENEIEQNAQEKVTEAKKARDNIKEGLTKQVDNTIGDFTLELGEVNDRIAKIREYLPGINASNKDKSGVSVASIQESVLSDGENKDNQQSDNKNKYTNTAADIKSAKDTAAVGKLGSADDVKDNTSQFDEGFDMIANEDWTQASKMSSEQNQAQHLQREIETSSKDIASSSESLARIGSKLTANFGELLRVTSSLNNLQKVNFSDVEPVKAAEIKREIKSLEARQREINKEQEDLQRKAEQEKSKIESSAKEKQEKMHSQNEAVKNYNETGNKAAEKIAREKEEQEKKKNI